MNLWLNQRHPDDERIEAVALGSVRGRTLAIIEEHLLVCQLCQPRLTQADEYIAALRAASRQLHTGEDGPPRTPGMVFA